MERINDTIKYVPEKLRRYSRNMSSSFFQELVHATEYGSTLAMVAPGHGQKALVRKPGAHVLVPTDPRVQTLRVLKGPVVF